MRILPRSGVCSLKDTTEHTRKLEPEQPVVGAADSQVLDLELETADQRFRTRQGPPGHWPPWRPTLIGIVGRRGGREKTFATAARRWGRSIDPRRCGARKSL